MAETVNQTIAVTTWTELSNVADSTVTVESTSPSYIIWSDTTPSETLRGHSVKDYVKATVGASEKLWIKCHDVPYIAIYTKDS